MTDPFHRANATLSPEALAAHTAYRIARHAWAEAIGRPVGERAKGGFPAGGRKSDG